MRLVIGSLMHESNIFSPVKTNLKSCRESYLLFDEDIIRFHQGRESELGGMINVASQENISLIPTVATFPLSGGRIPNETYSFLKKELLERVAKAGKIDGVLLSLHGSMATEDLDDAEGDLLETVRKQIGRDTYLVATLDYHASVSPQMVRNADVLVGYRTCPHTDHRATGERAARLVVSLFREAKNATMALEKIPMAVPYSTTVTGPMKRLMDKARQIEKKEGVISVSLFDGYHESGMRDLGPSIVVVTENDARLAQQRAVELKEMWWNLKEKFKPQWISLEEAIRKIKQVEKGPLVLSDVGDDPAGGAPGDGTVLLRALIENRVRNAVVAAIPDPESVQRAIQAGLGNIVTLRIGGKMDRTYSSPVEVTGKVKLISGGRYSFAGMEIDMGKAVVFGTEDIDIILTENRTTAHEPDFLRKFRIEPVEKRVLVIKTCGARWQELFENVISVDTPGWSNSGLILEWIKRERIPLSWNYWEQEK